MVTKDFSFKENGRIGMVKFDPLIMKILHKYNNSNV